jgi:hypothetical protein
MKKFYVTVAQTLLIRCEVEAESAEKAQIAVEDLGVDEFKNVTLSATTEVDRVDDENGKLVRWWDAFTWRRRLDLRDEDDKNAIQ